MKHHLDDTIQKLKGPTREQIIFHNQWAAVALDRYHENSKADFEFCLDNIMTKSILEWNSNFSSAAMKERVDMANHGAVAIAMFVMSVLLEYKYMEQTEIGDGVDYRFTKSEPNDDDLNFLSEQHYVEISGILEETGSNTLASRLRDKHSQIEKGVKRSESSSAIVTLFSIPKTVKEIHKK